MEMSTPPILLMGMVLFTFFSCTKPTFNALEISQHSQAFDTKPL